MTTTIAKFSPEWFNEQFEGYTPTSWIRQAAEQLCQHYDIGGICDPVYIANTIALNMGFGDGQGTWTETAEPYEPHWSILSRVEKWKEIGRIDSEVSMPVYYAAADLRFCYGCNILDDGVEAVKIIDKNFQGVDE